jgi:uncharacterized YkwD family protein
MNLLVSANFSQQEDFKMFKKKAILSVAAAAALLMSGAGINKAEASTTSPTTQERVYIYQSTNGDMSQFNRFLESFMKKYYTYQAPAQTVTQPVPTETQQPTEITETQQPTQTTEPVQQPQQPVTTEQPATTQTSYALSAYEQKVVDLTNQQRTNNGLSTLKIDLTLSKMAREKSRDMSVNNYFSHTSPTYGSPFDMMKQYGITYRYAGENIAMGQRTPEEVVNAWMNSEGHRKNILSANFTHIGVGYVSEGNYWTQEFIGK